MAIEKARCDIEECGKTINVAEGDELYDLGDVQLCGDCYAEMYDDLTEEGFEGYD